MFSYTCYRWYSEEYDWIYIDSPSKNFIFHVSATATGDAGDSLNNNFSPSNGMSFVTTGTHCSDLRGPSWYTSAKLCCYWNMFGSTAAGGFGWVEGPANNLPGYLSIARMMVKQTA